MVHEIWGKYKQITQTKQIQADNLVLINLYFNEILSDLNVKKLKNLKTLLTIKKLNMNEFIVPYFMKLTKISVTY